MARKYILRHHPERLLPADLTDDFCDVWLFKLYAYGAINQKPIALCCGLDSILQTKPLPYGALRFWMLHHVSKVARIWQHDIILS
jgi:hypothetical protein